MDNQVFYVESGRPSQGAQSYANQQNPQTAQQYYYDLDPSSHPGYSQYGYQQSQQVYQQQCAQASQQPRGSPLQQLPPGVAHGQPQWSYAIPEIASNQPNAAYLCMDLPAAPLGMYTYDPRFWAASGIQPMRAIPTAQPPARSTKRQRTGTKGTRTAPEIIDLDTYSSSADVKTSSVPRQPVQPKATVTPVEQSTTHDQRRPQKVPGAASQAAHPGAAHALTERDANSQLPVASAAQYKVVTSSYHQPRKTPGTKSTGEVTGQAACLVPEGSLEQRTKPLPTPPFSFGTAVPSTLQHEEPEAEPTEEELVKELEELKRIIERKKKRKSLHPTPPSPPEVASTSASVRTGNGLTPQKQNSDPARAYATPASSSPCKASPLPTTYGWPVPPPVRPIGPVPAPNSLPPLQARFENNSKASSDPLQHSVDSIDSCGEPEPPLCLEQQQLVDLIISGKNVFYTGSAGCGKSTVLRAFTRRLRAMGKKVDIVAPTGKAALQVNGSTTWTYLGTRPDHNKLPLSFWRKRAGDGKVKDRLQATDVLVIDEISMIENFHLERINEMMKAARKEPDHPEEPFGGVQVVVTGDFCQLPPVKPFQYCLQCGRTLTDVRNLEGSFHKCVQHGLYRDEDKWAFRSQAWEECNFEHFELTQVHRQSDELFIGMLQKCRKGLQLSEKEIEILMNHQVQGVKNATQLHAVRSSVEKINRERYEKIKLVPHTFCSLDHFAWQRALHPQLEIKGLAKTKDRDTRRPGSLHALEALREHRFDECVELKTGMLVVLLTNLDLDAGLCNGSQGTICGWETYDPAKLPKAVVGKKKKDEGEPSNPIFGDLAVMKEGLIRRFVESQHGHRPGLGGERVDQKKAWPKVHFLNGQRRTIYAECSVAELGDSTPYSLLSRTQVPLAPAWAMTIHKAQGMTMDKVVVNLSRAFEEGQTYVALSRARSLEGLKIDGDAATLRIGLGPNKEVQAFFRDKFGQGKAVDTKGETQVVENRCTLGSDCRGCSHCMDEVSTKAASA